MTQYKLYSFLNYQQLKPVIEQISHINYAILKGEVLSKLCYGKLGKRKSFDIDILVPKQEIYSLEQVLLANNFHSQMNRFERIFKLNNSHEIGAYSKQENGIKTILDINFDIFWGEYTSHRIDISEFLSDTSDMEIYGVNVKTLPVIKNFIHLVLHHYKEMNSLFHLSNHNCINTTMFSEIYLILKNFNKEISLEKLLEISTTYNIVPYVFYILYYTNKLFKDPYLQKYVDAFENPMGISLLDCYGLNQKERKTWTIDFETRLNTDLLYDYIIKDLSEEDVKKINVNQKFFG